MDITDRRIILPGDPEFDLTLAVNLPPNWGQVAHQTSGQYVTVARADSGVLESVGESDFLDYLHGGEYAQRLSEIEGDHFDDHEFLDG